MTSDLFMPLGPSSLNPTPSAPPFYIRIPQKLHLQNNVTWVVPPHNAATQAEARLTFFTNKVAAMAECHADGLHDFPM